MTGSTLPNVLGFTCEGVFVTPETVSAHLTSATARMFRVEEVGSSPRVSGQSIALNAVG